jgi:hypothetical protein
MAGVPGSGDETMVQYIRETEKLSRYRYIVMKRRQSYWEAKLRRVAILLPVILLTCNLNVRAAEDVERLANEVAQFDPQAPVRADVDPVTAADQRWWSFRPLAHPKVPSTPDDPWSQNSIDHFVYEKMATHGLSPAPQADKHTLLRRLYFDLLGLPPTPEQIDRYVEDDKPDAWERQIDELLANPHYGEHWARHWLDVVRYAESDGWNKDSYRPHLWRYRDYVISAFNQDKPYPQFVRQQLAGDEMDGDDPENLAATGFLRLGIYEYNQRDARAHWNDILNETTDVLGDVFFGLGIACARCHDHKFDPLLQTDYYRLRAFVEPILWRDGDHYATPAQRADHARQQDIWEKATHDLRAQRDVLLRPYYEQKEKFTVDRFPLEIQACYHQQPAQRTSWEAQMAYLIQRQFIEEGMDPLKKMAKAHQKQHQALLKALSEFESLKPQPLSPLMSVANSQGRATPTVVPGDRKQTPIEPGFPAVLTDVDVLTDADAAEQTHESWRTNPVGRRTALAQWIGRGDNGLTMRVMVNRIWQQHFGTGLVPTTNDFGRLGQSPTHPRLLDWLTIEYVEQGWSIKWLHKQILMSATWQQSAQHPLAGHYLQLDPEEKLRWRAPIRRLQAEQIHDAILSVSGALQQQVGGPSVEVNVARRGIYVKSFRNTFNPLLHAFDVPGGLKSVGQRDSTTTPTQALLMLNGDSCQQRSSQLAHRLQQHATNSPGERLEYAFRLAWGRTPTPSEFDQTLSFVLTASEPDSHRIDPDRLIDFCHVLLNSNEFLYID